MSWKERYANRAWWMCKFMVIFCCFIVLKARNGRQKIWELSKSEISDAILFSTLSFCNILCIYSIISEWNLWMLKLICMGCFVYTCIIDRSFWENQNITTHSAYITHNKMLHLFKLFWFILFVCCCFFWWIFFKLFLCFCLCYSIVFAANRHK